MTLGELQMYCRELRARGAKPDARVLLWDGDRGGYISAMPPQLQQMVVVDRRMTQRGDTPIFRLRENAGTGDFAQEGVIVIELP